MAATVLDQIARMIDHALLLPTMPAVDVAAGCDFARSCNLAAVCVKSADVAIVHPLLKGSSVALCAVVGFPHGNTSANLKAAEAAEAIAHGATEIDMVVNLGRVTGQDWAAVAEEIAAVRAECNRGAALLKVIFETHLISEEAIVRLCEIGTDAGVDFVKTCTGFGYVRQADGHLSTPGATEAHVRLMRKHSGQNIRIKASGGIRSLGDLLRLRACGATRFGTSAAAAILEEARACGLDQADASWPLVNGAISDSREY